METVEFFTHIFSDQTGRAVIVLPNYAGKPTIDKWFQWPSEAQAMADFADSKSTGDVWFSPVLFNSDSRTKDNAKVISVFGADADECSPNNFRLQPSITVASSENRWQVYWMTQSIDPNEAAKINRRISQVHKDQGCDIAYVNAAKLMRVPGTSNSKHPGAVVIVEDFEFVYYTREEVEARYTAEEIPDAVEVVNLTMPEGMDEYIAENRSRLLNGMPNSIGIRDLLFGKFQEDKRSDVLFKLCMELFRIGLDAKDVLAIAWGAPSNKFKDEDPRGMSGLWSTAVIAAKAAYDKEQNEPYVETPELEEDVRPQLPSQKAMTNFLTPDEQDMINAVVNFIDEWVEWAGSINDSPAEYHRAAAVMLLSTVYSQFGHATPKFAPEGLKLNIWIMVLGRSTKDRKTTSRRFAERALRALKNDDYSYTLGEDVTPGGISLVLQDRAHLSTAFLRDEAQGLFKELLHQSYMSGGLEVFTKLYDGWSGGRVRASGEKKVQESVPVSFVMLLMGILSETTDILTVTNYRSGFLTRFVYVIGTRPDDWKADPMQQADGEETEDLVFKSLVDHLKLNRNYWEMARGGDDTKTFGLRADDDAWARLQQYENDVSAKLEGSPYGEILSSTSDRMVITTLKLAALLAMDDRSRTIKLIHMLQAISYAGEWFDNAVTVASMVSASEWERDVDKLEAYINSKGGKVAYATAYRQFPEKRPMDFEELLRALEGRGVLNRTQVNNRWMLEIDYSE